MENTMRNSAKAIIVRDGRLLVTVNRGDKGGEFYILPGGAQNFGETLHEALQRECIEEIGTNVDIRDLVFVREYIGKHHEFAGFDRHVHQVEFMFLCAVTDDASVRQGTLPDPKQFGVKWIRLTELETAPFYPAALKTVIREMTSLHVRYLGDVN